MSGPAQGLERRHSEAAGRAGKSPASVAKRGQAKGGKPLNLPIPFRSHPAIDRRSKCSRLRPLLVDCRKALIGRA